jgi:hypothetical protein
MSVGDTIALIGALITVVGLILAQRTYSNAVSSRAIVDMKVGEELALHYSPDHRLYLRADFAFLNRGAQPAALVRIGAVLLTGDKDVPEVHLRWRTFEDTTNSVDRGWVTGSTGTVRALVIPGRAAGASSITERIRLVAYPRDPGARLPLLGPDARLTFTAHVDYAQIPSCTYPCRLHISPSHATALNTRCKERINDDGRAVFDARLFLLRDISPSRESTEGIDMDTFSSWGIEKHLAL